MQYNTINIFHIPTHICTTATHTQTQRYSASRKTIILCALLCNCAACLFVFRLFFRLIFTKIFLQESHCNTQTVATCYSQLHVRVLHHKIKNRHTSMHVACATYALTTYFHASTHTYIHTFVCVCFVAASTVAQLADTSLCAINVLHTSIAPAEAKMRRTYTAYTYISTIHMFISAYVYVCVLLAAQKKVLRSQVTPITSTPHCVALQRLVAYCIVALLLFIYFVVFVFVLVFCMYICVCF